MLYRRASAANQSVRFLAMKCAPANATAGPKAGTTAAGPVTRNAPEYVFHGQVYTGKSKEPLKKEIK